MLTGDILGPITCHLESNPGTPPYCAFDWDGTLLDGDSGDAFFLHLLERTPDLRPFVAALCAQSWVSSAARAALDAAAAHEAPRAAETLDLIHELYFNETCLGEAAFHGFDTSLFRPSYALPVFLYSGMETETARLEAEALVISANGHQLRERPELTRLVAELLRSGVAVFVVTASPYFLVETYLRHLGLAACSVVGLRSMEANGRFLPKLWSPGGPGPCIPWRLGKVRHLKAAIEAAGADSEARPLLAAGNSEGDLALLGLAEKFRLLVTKDEGLIARASALRGNATLVTLPG